MIDWSRGGPAGSITWWATREVREHFRTNSTMRRARYGALHRTLRAFFALATFGRFVLAYALVNSLALLAEGLSARFVPDVLPHWTAPGGVSDLKTVLLNLSGYLIGAQVGVLGLISLALALVTIIAQRENASTDVKLYYHESLAFEIFASCIALLAVLCTQLIWPGQFALHRLGFGTDLLVFKIALFCLHVIWLLINLVGLAHFIRMTFDFVQQSARERLRERYTANVVIPLEMREKLHEQLYGLGAADLDRALPGQRRCAEFGIDFGSPAVVEVTTTFLKPVAVRDVRMRLVRWVVRRWINRSGARMPLAEKARRGQSGNEPVLWFTPRFGIPVQGKVEWCKRRGGVPLDALERFVLRRAFVFGRVKDEN